MEFFRIKKDIPFMKYALALNIISLLLFLAAVFFLVTRGLNLSSEFTGGTVLSVHYESTVADVPRIREKIDALGYGVDAKVQPFGVNDIEIRLPLHATMSTDEQVAQVMGILKQMSPDAQLIRQDSVGSVVGGELTYKGLMALGLVVFGVIIYLAIRFEWKFGVAGILANLHDVVIIMGFFAYFQWEFSLVVLTAILAVLGYSVNESVVIFDRIREAFRRYRKMNTEEVINHAITSTMSRTIITHGSTEAVVLCMFFLGGPTLHYFALALTIGILFGIYSSVFVAAALVMWFGVKREDFIKEKVARHDPNDPNAGAVV